MRRELLAGCGSSRKKQVRRHEVDPEEWSNLTTLDMEARHNPDVVWDLNVLPWPFEDNSFDECHFYEVLEHFGQQGDFRAFFAHFSEIWRILKPDGLLFASCPAWDSPWAWSDPGHTRIISKSSLIYLDQREYVQVGQTSITDYRDIYKANFEPVAGQETEHGFSFIMKAVK